MEVKFYHIQNEPSSIAKDFKILPKWLKLAKSGHTVCCIFERNLANFEFLGIFVFKCFIAIQAFVWEHYQPLEVISGIKARFVSKV